MERRTIWGTIWETIWPTVKRRKIDLEQGWVDIQEGLTKLKAIVEGSGDRFTSEEYMKLYTTIYNMCTPGINKRKMTDDFCPRLYEMYRKALEEYMNDMVLPCIREKHDECMLMELVARWNKYKLMVGRLSRLFHYLDKYFIPRMSLSPLGEVGLTCFRDLVYEEVKGKATGAINVLIDKEREGEHINRELLKDVLNIYVQIGMGILDHYEEDFEKHMLEDTSAYYSRKASKWVLEDSCPDYLLKCEECLKKERDRASNFLQSSTKPKLIERVQRELLGFFPIQLLEKEHSGCCALLRDDNVDDLSRMYRLYHEIPRGLDSDAAIFKQHVAAEGMVSIQQAEDAASSHVS